MRKLASIVSLALMVSVGAAFAAESDTTKSASKTPVELTQVSGRLMTSDDKGASNGIAYFIFQNRLMEIPHENSLERVKAIAETSVVVDADGSFTLNMAPGNFAMVYDPSGNSADAGKPGPESMATMKKKTREQVEARVAAIKENAQKGLAVENGKMGEAFVVENRAVRPPTVDFGEMVLSSDHSVTVLAVDKAGKPVDFPVLLHLRGKSGDICEAHPPSVSETGKFVFHDVFPQTYQVFATGTKPKPGAGDEATTPSLKNTDFIFDGKPHEQKVTVTPGEPGGAPEPTPPPQSDKAPKSRLKNLKSQ